MFGVAWDEQTQQRLAEETRLAIEEQKMKELELGSQDGRSVIGSAITRRSSSTAGKSGRTSHSKGSAVSKLKRAFLGARLSNKSDDKPRPSSYYAPSSRLSSIFAENNYIISGNSDQLVIPDINHINESGGLSKVHTAEDQPAAPAPPKQIQESTALEELEGLKTPQSKPPTFVIHTAPSTPEDAENHTSTDDPPTTTLIQWLDEDSYITRTTTVTYEPRGDADVNDQVIKTTISADPSPFSTTKSSKLRPSPPIVRPAAPAADDAVPSFSSLVDNWFTALQGPSRAVLPSPPSAKNNDKSGPSRVIRSAEAHDPTSTQGFHPVSKAPSLPLKSPKLRVTNPDVWKPPNDWGCQSPTELFPKAIEKQDKLEVIKHDQKNKDVARMQKDVEFIAISSPKKVLSRLTQGFGETSDTSPHLQEEQDGKRLMLSVLYDMCGSTATVVDTASQPDQSVPCAAGQKILALFESEATASYLAVTFSEAAITHLSLSPLPHELFPNVHPLFAPPNKASISFAANSFNTVYCLSLPSLVPAHEILEVLKQIHRCLAPNGILQLVLLDPFPVARRLGPRTRKWFEKHILSNLQSQSRCVRPSAIFPGFLEEAQFRVREEPSTKIKFLAIPPDPTDMFIEGQQRIQEELRSVVGRMLWQEVWGKMVTGDDNWWDDPECVEECSRLGTFFEFSRIEAVKVTDAEVLGGFSVGC
ncbi:hypothetical protein GE21DRAFT_7082 [Neurospora crassa]|uniref:Uncharacterized protein n=2 Tax=Neurospora crassa TaxID=5141 RepID=Q1K629_NEUCR|nr:hypothetical protein NCU04624 [Neurospora crassa OR74A]EAA28706.1 hypothetical protein NCU04624 [Neurospora crassa OR74A]KHE79434.1 hypothetical protein GE21DRAFT_7082 [Neurospora crassa]CAD37065.1 hypothetical protein [Neurospora crassa]|eukprot:XP_957942.1 hypothetical protein NCU04624 [Neurospora crassa OR74A]